MVDFTKGGPSAGFFAPLRYEADVYDCEVQGTIPKELDGAFIRVGGDYFYPPKRQDDSPFSIDGYISSFRIKNGIADFKGRWIKTPRFLNNLAARKQLYGVYRNPFTADIDYVNKPYLGTVMNTAPIAHHGKLYALKEDAQPFEIDPNTLETLGAWNFDGAYKAQTFSAHPKVDPVSGDMICYGYEATGLCTDDLWIYTVSPKGKVKHEIRIKVPYVSTLHDMVLTQKYLIFPVYGYVTSIERLKAGHLHWAWDKSKPTYWGILRRDGDGDGKDVRWFKGPASVVMHTINAFDDDNKVIVDAPISDGNPFPFFPQIDGSPFVPKEAQHQIRRLTFDMSSKSDSYDIKVFDQQDVVDLARVDDRYLTLPYKYVYSMMSDPSKPYDAKRAGAGNRVVNTYFRYDLTNGEWRKYFIGDVHNLQELSFIPRSEKAPEGDGWIVGTASNYAEMRTEMVIVDALSMQEQARIILPFRMTPQVHGRWYSAKELPLQDKPLPAYKGRTQA